jgi:hypothetical protein
VTIRQRRAPVPKIVNIAPTGSASGDRLPPVGHDRDRRSCRSSGGTPHGATHHRGLGLTIWTVARRSRRSRSPSTARRLRDRSEPPQRHDHAQAGCTICRRRPPARMVREVDEAARWRPARGCFGRPVTSRDSCLGSDARDRCFGTRTHLQLRPRAVHRRPDHLNARTRHRGLVQAEHVGARRRAPTLTAVNRSISGDDSDLVAQDREITGWPSLRGTGAYGRSARSLTQDCLRKFSCVSRIVWCPTFRIGSIPHGIGC